MQSVRSYAHRLKVPAYDSVEAASAVATGGMHMLVAQAGGKGCGGLVEGREWRGVEGSQQLGCADGHGRQSRPGEPSSGPIAEQERGDAVSGW